jgi:hypothetical protein
VHHLWSALPCVPLQQPACKLAQALCAWRVYCKHTSLCCSTGQTTAHSPKHFCSTGTVANLRLAS